MIRIGGIRINVVAALHKIRLTEQFVGAIYNSISVESFIREVFP